MYVAGFGEAVKEYKHINILYIVGHMYFSLRPIFAVLTSMLRVNSTH